MQDTVFWPIGIDIFTKEELPDISHRLTDAQKWFRDNGYDTDELVRLTDSRTGNIIAWRGHRRAQGKVA